MTKSNIDPMTLVDAELRPMLELMLQLLPPTDGDISYEQLVAIRQRHVAMQKPYLDSPPVVERVVTYDDGAPGVPVYLINADPAEKRPAILHMHGGGFVAGTAAGSVADLQVVAKTLDCVVVTVEYRLAPETTFQGSLEDNYAALRWLRDHAEEIGVDISRIAVMGESAGAGHAAILALAARDRGEVAVCFQALSYPMLDDRTGSAVDVPAHIGTYVWRPNFNIAGWTAFLGQPAGSAGTPAVAVPARVNDLTGLPPAFIGTGSLDLFVAEDLDYARRLIDAGVPTEVLVVPGAYHAFDFIVPASSGSRRYRLALFNALARAFGRQELVSAPEPAPLSFMPAVGAPQP